MIPFDEMTYSIVIPAYNEGQRLGGTLEKVLAYVRQQGWDAEVIVVNDGSRDNTAQIVRMFAEKNPIVRLVENPGNRGKGYSVRNGILNSRGRYRGIQRRGLVFAHRRNAKVATRSGGRSRYCHRFALAAL